MIGEIQKEISAEERSQIKGTIYGIIYGMGSKVCLLNPKILRIRKLIKYYEDVTSNIVVTHVIFFGV